MQNASVPYRCNLNILDIIHIVNSKFIPRKKVNYDVLVNTNECVLYIIDSVQN